MDQVEIEQAFTRMQELWPAWNPPKAQIDLFQSKLYRMRADWFDDAITAVVTKYASREPSLAWFFKAYDVTKEHRMEARHPDREAAKLAEEEQLQREVAEGDARIHAALTTLSTATLAHYRDRVNDMGFFQKIEGLDLEAWGSWKRGNVWAKWKNDEAMEESFD